MTERLMTWQSVVDCGWLLLLLFLLWYFWNKRRVLQKMGRWEKTTGQITSCEWETQAHRLWPKIEYLYKVDEREFVGDAIFIDTSHRTFNNPYARKIAYEVAKAFKENEYIDVYYNPQEPDEAVLDVTIPGKLNFILLLIVGLIAAHLIIVGLRLFR